MEYTVQKLSRLAGVSPRTLRFYDEIGILKPARINSSGYRIYGRKEVDALQQILFYRELGVPLEDIREIMASPGFDALKALREHHGKLLEKRERLDRLILNVEKSIAAREEKTNMRDDEKFEGFKRSLVEENEGRYGKEAREKYGDKAVDRSNNMVLNMSKEQHEALTRLSYELIEVLKDAFKTGDPAGELAQKAADMHRQWLCFFWNEYTREAHAGVAQMYVEDERFTEYYDKHQPVLARFLRDAVLIYTRN